MNNSIRAGNKTGNDNLCFDLSNVPDKFSIKIELMPLESDSTTKKQAIEGV